MVHKMRWILTILTVVAAAVLVIILWPAGRPFAGVETVAIQIPNWGKSPNGEVIKGPFVDGLQLTLGEINVTVVDNLANADALLVIKDIKTGKIEVKVGEGKIKGRVTATLILTNLENGKYYTLYFYLTFGDGKPKTRLKVRRFWELWK